MTAVRETKAACGNPECLEMSYDGSVYFFGSGYVFLDNERCLWSTPCLACAMAYQKKHPGAEVWPTKTAKPRQPGKYVLNPEGFGPFAGHTQPHLVVHDPTPQERDFIVGLVTDNYMPSPRYQLSHQVSAFLQSDHEEFVLVEFWTNDLVACQRWVDWLNANYPQEVER
jgi:hypothetical protein